jgi:hypothetical protein
MLQYEKHGGELKIQRVKSDKKCDRFCSLALTQGYLEEAIET